MDSIVITSDHLTRRFGDLTAVDGLSLNVYQGEVFGFLGHNGAGKTTTIRLLNGVLTPTNGTAAVLGLDPIRDGSALRKRTGVLTENPSLDERLSARELLTMYANLYDVPESAITPRVGKVLEMFDLDDRASEKVGGFSKGMRQRLALARALIHEPEVLFLDEPTSGLDPVAARLVRDLIRRLSSQEGRTVFLNTHNLPEAQRLCDRVAVLEHGKLIALGTPAEMGERILHTTQRIELEVAPEAVERAVAIVGALPGVRDVTTEVDVITATGGSRAEVPAVVAALAEAQIPIFRVTPQEPTLEDIYFALHGETPEVIS